MLDAPDEEAAHQMVLEMPFSPFSDVDVTPDVPGDVGLRTAQQAFAATSGAR